MITASPELLPRKWILTKLRGVTRPSAISKLIQLHNDGVIEGDRRRFRPLAAVGVLTVLDQRGLARSAAPFALCALSFLCAGCGNGEGHVAPSLLPARARQQQREISSEVQTGCQLLLRDTFDAAKDMKGTGSHQRRKTMVE